MPRFNIPKPAPKPPTTASKTVRFPNWIIEQVENQICGTGCTFTAFVVEAVRVALLDLQQEKGDSPADREETK